jgi:hypothetical protein
MRSHIRPSFLPSRRSSSPSSFLPSVVGRRSLARLLLPHRALLLRLRTIHAIHSPPAILSPCSSLLFTRSFMLSVCAVCVSEELGTLSLPVYYNATAPMAKVPWFIEGRNRAANLGPKAKGHRNRDVQRRAALCQMYFVLRSSLALRLRCYLP